MNEEPQVPQPPRSEAEGLGEPPRSEAEGLEGQEEDMEPQSPETAAEAPVEEAPVEEAPVAPPVSPPPAALPDGERKLVRRPEGKIIAGVCSGLGAYTGTDPVIWRIGFVVLALTTGIGLLGYIVAWLVMPMGRRGEPLPEEPRSLNAGRWLGIAAIVVGGLIFAKQVFNFHTSWFWGILLIGLGLALWGRDWTRPERAHPEHLRGAPPRSSAVTQPDETSVPSSAPFSQTAFAETTGTAPIVRSEEVRSQPTEPLTAPPAVPRGKKRPPSILGRLVVGACALAIGGALLLSNLGVVHATPKSISALLLGIVGAGLLIGTIWGRARWLIFPGIVLALMLTTVTAIPFNTRGGFGDANWTPQSLRTVRRTYEHAAGPAKLDLTHVNFGSRRRTMTVRLGFGPLLVIVPKNVNVIADGHVQGGPISLFGHGGAGWDVSDVVESRVKDATATLRIHARVTFGPLLVDREGSRVDRFTGRNFDALEVR